MILNIKFFAKYRECYGEGLKISLDKEEIRIIDLIDILEDEYNISIKEDFNNGNVIVSKDCEITTGEDVINGDSEIGIYPPVSGG
ncbi:MAG: sulfur-carrier protein [Methanothermococcus sp.]|jgi:molybdopterin synthase sulfur carrier subunit|uniref:MoaD/ThiS family protein n=1 Tax=Methanothermococcus TaxID=155862 RepID=UPI000362BAC5|nr:MULTISPECIES: MoaD/ThiS family protein [Methanothermococcus]MDK2789835.1 sulfur-carrier protein [Methanothermococcus sp.]MDK2987962.1 sulfur-carrier protein [Methanothermococcus sp.]